MTMLFLDFQEPKVLTNSVSLTLLRKGAIRVGWLLVDDFELRRVNSGYAAINGKLKNQYSISACSKSDNEESGPNNFLRKDVWSGAWKAPLELCSENSPDIADSCRDPELKFNTHKLAGFDNFEGLSSKQVSFGTYNCYKVPVNVPITKSSRNGDYFLTQIINYDLAGNSQFLQWPTRAGPFVTYKGSIPGVWHLNKIYSQDFAGNELSADLAERILVYPASNQLTMLFWVFFYLGSATCAVLNCNGPSGCTLVVPSVNPIRATCANKLVDIKSVRNAPSIRALVRSKAVATVPSCLEVGALLDRAVRRVNKFNVKYFFQKYDHLIYSRLLRSLTRVPPLTASYLLVSGAAAVLSYLFNDNFPFSWMTFDFDKVMSGQFWRLFTPYFLFGQLWLNHYMLTSSALSYMANVELAHINKPEKFIEFLSFGVFSLSAYSFLESYFCKKYSIREGDSFGNLAYHLHVFVLYFWSRINEGQSVDCMDLFSIPAEYIPYLFILQNLLFHQTGVFADLFAIFSSYIYFNLFSNRKTCFLFRAFRTDSLRKLYLKFRDEIPY